MHSLRSIGIRRLPHLARFASGRRSIRLGDNAAVGATARGAVPSEAHVAVHNSLTHELLVSTHLLIMYLRYPTSTFKVRVRMRASPRARSRAPSVSFASAPSSGEARSAERHARASMASTKANT